MEEEEEKTEVRTNQFINSTKINHKEKGDFFIKRIIEFISIGLGFCARVYQLELMSFWVRFCKMREGKSRRNELYLKLRFLV